MHVYSSKNKDKVYNEDFTAVSPNYLTTTQEPGTSSHSIYINSGKNTLYGIDITEVSECKLIYQKY